METSGLERIHNLKQVYTDFRIIFNLVGSGYQFSDQETPTVLKQLEKALSVLQSEISILEKKQE